MTDFALNARPREENGRRPSRRLRREGLVPAVVYGDGKPARGITLEARELRKLLPDDRAYTHIIALHLPDGTETALIRDIQMHPYKEEVVHMDFLRVHAGERVTLHVPVHLLGEAQCVGLKAGGVLHRAVVELEVEAPVDRLPEAIEVDIRDLQIGESLHLSQIALPDGVQLLALKHEDDKEIVSVHNARIGGEEEGEEAAPAS